MQSFQLPAGSGFDVLATTRHTQAASMVLGPGQCAGGPHNRHEADQWLYVVSGSGEVIIEGNTVELDAGSLVLIEAGEAHEVRAKEAGLSTVNIYGPPEY